MSITDIRIADIEASSAVSGHGRLALYDAAPEREAGRHGLPPAPFPVFASAGELARFIRDARELARLRAAGELPEAW
ncbi:MAG TPA: hypothetical protein VGF32_24325 [Streptosporangiaceae bacterium]|jgi:hypothetical protein